MRDFGLVLVYGAIGLLRKHCDFRDFRAIFGTIFRHFRHFCSCLQTPK